MVPRVLSQYANTITKRPAGGDARENNILFYRSLTSISQIEYAQHNVTLAWGNLGTTSHTISVRGTEDVQVKKNKTQSNTCNEGASKMSDKKDLYNDSKIK